jgi:hypothetical protein
VHVRSRHDAGAVTHSPSLCVCCPAICSMRPGPAGWEDGTPPFLDFPAVIAGLAFIDRLGGFPAVAGALGRRAACIEAVQCVVQCQPVASPSPKPGRPLLCSCQISFLYKSCFSSVSLLNLPSAQSSHFSMLPPLLQHMLGLWPPAWPSSSPACGTGTARPSACCTALTRRCFSHRVQRASSLEWLGRAQWWLSTCCGQTAAVWATGAVGNPCSASSAADYCCCLGVSDAAV